MAGAKKKATAMTPKEVMDSINKEYPGALRLASDDYFQIRWVPTGVLAFDRMTGGGIPLGRYTEIFGVESALKSLLATIAASRFQQEFPDKRVMWIDAEGSFDKKWVARWGVDMDRLDVITPDTGEQATAILEIAMLSRGYCLFIVDSIAAMTPQREVEYDAEDTTKAMGAAGRMTSQMMRRLTRLNHNDCAFILINQVRDSLGVMFGDPAKPTGGRAIPFYAGLRIQNTGGETLKKDVERYKVGGGKGKQRKTEARVISMRVRKDKVGSNEDNTGSILWYPNEGRIDEEESLLLLGIADDIVIRSGPSVRIKFGAGEKKVDQSFKGWANAKEWLRKNPKIARRMALKISKKTAEGTVAA